MQAVTAADLLDVWDAGRDASPGERGLLLLELAESGLPANALGGWSAGRRDAALLSLRQRVFGPTLAGVAACPSCGEALELEVAVADLVVAGSAAPPVPAPLTLAEGPYRVTFRLPSAADLAELGAADPGVGGERWLLERCIVEARRSDAGCTPAELPSDVLAEVAAAMESADPQAEIELSLACATCGEDFRLGFDVVAFLWREIEAQAVRLVRQVATLAAAFGWSERDILAMSPARRAWYVELAGG
jgi:hypothetical protein